MSNIPEKIGRYEIIEEIGRGGMGAVYKALDPNIGRMVALKVIKLAFNAEGDLAREMHERFKREAKAAGVLSHPNVVTVYDAGEKDGTPYIAMEYVEGDTLEDLIDPEVPLPIEKVNSIIKQVATGLAYAHEKGVVHRDVKPANVIVTKDGFAKITDFGIARLSDSELTQRGTVMGSPSYMSPEQVTGRPVDGRSDVFSLGVILYQLLTGEKPFPGENPTVVSYRIVREEPPEPTMVNPVIPKGYDAIIRKALAKSPDDRYAAASEMAMDIERLETGKAVAGPKTTGATLYTRVSKRLEKPGFKPLVVGFVTALSLIILVIVSLRVSNPYIEIQELIDGGQHERAVIALHRILTNKPKDHRAAFLLGGEYAELKDYESCVKAYAHALLLKPDYRDDAALQDDLVTALKLDEADTAVHLVVSRIGPSITEKLRNAISDQEYDHTQNWNAAKALRELGEKVDEFEILKQDLQMNPDCEVRRTAVERLGELGDKRALPVLEIAKRDKWNTRSCMGNSIKEAEEKINGENPEPLE